MKKNYQRGAQKRQAKRRKIAETARNSQQPSSWLTQPETSKADKQDVSIRESEIPILLKIDQMQAKMTTFPLLLQLRDEESNYCSRSQTTSRTFP